MLATQSSAAEITLRKVASSESGRTTVLFRLEGAISQDDVKSVKATIDSAKIGIPKVDEAVIELESPGGVYSAGLKLATEFRRQGIGTVVRSRDECYSACALAFLGGAERLRDTTVYPGEIPNQPPARVLEPGALLGFHAPFLEIQNSTYNASNLQDAYRAAVDGISLLISLSDHFYVEPAELPRLLEPDRHSAFMVDTVDAVRTLWIDYADRSLQPRDLRSITQTMVASACINKWYHRQRRSALPGYAQAIRAAKDFKEGSALLRNGEQDLAFGVRPVRHGTQISGVAFMPITMTKDGKNFVWCIFDWGRGEPRVLYRPAGTVADLFRPIAKSNDIFDFQMAEGVIAANTEGGVAVDLLRVLDMVPADTRLVEVSQTIRMYQTAEPDLFTLAR